MWTDRHNYTLEVFFLCTVVLVNENEWTLINYPNMKAINLKTICGFFCWKEPRYVSVDLWDEGICPEEPERDPDSVEGYLHAHRCSRSHTGKIVANFFKVISLVLTNNQTVKLNLSFHLSNLKVFKLIIYIFFLISREKKVLCTKCYFRLNAKSFLGPATKNRWLCSRIWWLNSIQSKSYSGF